MATSLFAKEDGFYPKQQQTDKKHRPFFVTLEACNVPVVEMQSATRRGISMARLSTSRSQNSKLRAPLPAILRDDTRPDPSVLSETERLKEFGRLMFRAIERLLEKKSLRKTIKDPN